MSIRRHHPAGLPSSVAPRRIAHSSTPPSVSYATLPSSIRPPQAGALPSRELYRSGDAVRTSLARSRSTLPSTPRPQSRVRQEQNPPPAFAQPPLTYPASYYSSSYTTAPPSRKGSDTSTHSYTSSASSSGDSVFERTSQISTSSSRSSLNEEFVIKDVTYKSSIQDTSPPVARSRESVGNTWWSKVTAAAGTLTTTVTRAWERSQETEDYQEQESHLEDVLKKYYIERARAPSDLPAWLFHEHERHPERVFKRYSAELEASQTEEAYGGSSFVRDPPSSAQRPAVLSLPSNPNPGGDPSRPINRLKEIREAKRRAQATQLATSQSSSAQNSQPRYPQTQTQVQGPTSTTSLPREKYPASGADVMNRSMRRQPVGLPSGPGRAGRRF